MNTILYVHGYGSTGDAWKAQVLRHQFPTVRVVSPTVKYDESSPYAILDQLERVIEAECPDVLVGSSMGGYFSMCLIPRFEGRVWCVNPVRDVLSMVRRVVDPLRSSGDVDTRQKAEQMMQSYASFDREVFRSVNPADGQLNFFLSKDDELLGSHEGLLRLFPNHGRVVWRDEGGHHYTKFEEDCHVIG